MKGRKPQTQPDVVLNNFTDKTYVLTSEKTPRQFFLRSRHKKNAPLTYFDGKAQRALRYASNQVSVFEDEQLGEVIVEAVVFSDGKLVVPKENPTLQEFLDKHPANKANGGNSFIMYNPEKSAEEELDFIELEAEAVSIARSLSVDKLESIALAVFGVKSSNKTSVELKRDVLRFAKDNPKDFLHLASDDLTELVGLAKKAEDLNLVRFDKGNYYNENRLLFKVPYDIKDPTQALAKWMRQDKEGEAFLSYIKKELA